MASVTAAASMEDVRSWLEEGRDEAEDLVDLRWEVLEEKRGEDGGLASFRATHPALPVNLLVLHVPIGEGPGAVRLVVETGLDTVDLEPGEKLRLYRSLLRLSRMPLAKYYLYGEEHEIGIAVDLDLRSLSREEFNDALATLALAYLYLRDLSPSLRERMRREEVRVLAKLVANYVEKGRSREEIVELFTRSGLSRKEAEKIVSSAFREAGRGGATIYM